MSDASDVREEDPSPAEDPPVVPPPGNSSKLRSAGSRQPTSAGPASSVSHHVVAIPEDENEGASDDHASQGGLTITQARADLATTALPHEADPGYQSHHYDPWFEGLQSGHPGHVEAEPFASPPSEQSSRYGSAVQALNPDLGEWGIHEGEGWMSGSEGDLTEEPTNLALSLLRTNTKSELGAEEAEEMPIVPHGDGPLPEKVASASAYNVDARLDRLTMEEKLELRTKQQGQWGCIQRKKDYFASISEKDYLSLDFHLRPEVTRWLNTWSSYAKKTPELVERLEALSETNSDNITDEQDENMRKTLMMTDTMHNTPLYNGQIFSCTCPDPTAGASQSKSSGGEGSPMSRRPRLGDHPTRLSPR